MHDHSVAFLFPGQGAQVVGMGRDIFDNFGVARRTFEEVDDLLHRNLSRLIFEGPEDMLTATANSQLALYTVSMAFLRVLGELSPDLVPNYVAGLSLGEYSALTAAHYLDLVSGVRLVEARSRLMSEACERHPGKMAVVLGLDANNIQQQISSSPFAGEAWIANLNCPGQVVISGSERAIVALSQPLIACGAKRVLSLNVQGAFHSGLMSDAAAQFGAFVEEVSWMQGRIPVALNVTGGIVDDLSTIKKCAVAQITAPVLWEKSIRSLVEVGVTLFLEIGSGTTLTALNKRIGIQALTLPIGKISDLTQLQSLCFQRG